MIGLDDISVENEGELFIWSYANTHGDPQGTFSVTNISVRAGGKMEPLTSGAIQMTVVAVTVVVNGRGYIRTNDLQMNATNVTIDLSGLICTNYLEFLLRI